MSAIHDLIAQVSDTRLRERLAAEWANAAKEKKFGLVFEDHLPELLPLHSAKPRKGDLVCRRQGALKDVWQIKSIHAGVATCVKPSNETHPSEPTRTVAEQMQFSVDQLLVVREFGEPIFPALAPVDAVANGPADAPWHTLIEADNYHALQLLDYLYAGQVDCIYIDPPYNTGARDWKYNNDYVDGNDGWRHSKWLAFMEKRLKIARRLLKVNDSVLIITIDDYEVSHLDCLLQSVYPDWTRFIITIEHSKRGRRGKNFAKSNEFALILVPKGCEPISEQPLNEAVGGVRNMRRTGSGSLRAQRWRKFYPIYIDSISEEILEIGTPLELGCKIPSSLPADVLSRHKECLVEAIWPISEDGIEKNWHYARPRAIKEWEQDKLFVKRQKYGPQIYFCMTERGSKKFKTVWTGSWLDASTHGTELLEKILGKANAFDFPKSVYATRQALIAATLEKPNALIVDFFAGSGTTLNAVNLLNASDCGQRRCILVTNNEVSADESAALIAQGLQPGSAEWEAQGICRSVTWPRSKYTILGKRDNGTLLTGEYLTGKTVECEKARYFKQIGFVDSAQLDTLPKKKQLVSLINGLPQALVKEACSFIVSEDHNASVLFDPVAAEGWLAALDGQDHITDFYIVTPTKRVFEQLKVKVAELLGPILVPEEEKRPMSAGFAANLAYFKLDFLERERVSLRRAFHEILPLLWLKAGAVGPRPELKRGESEPVLFAPEGSNFMVLLDETRMGHLLKSLEGRTDLSQVFIVTDADESFKTMAQDVREVAGKANPALAVVQLYRDYLLNFMINKNQDRAAGHADTQGARA